MTAPAPGRMRGDGWISANDRMPKPGVPVLCWWPVKTGVKVEACEFIDGYWMYSQDGDVPGEPPTHWQPLPAPPVADGQEGEG